MGALKLPRPLDPSELRRRRDVLLQQIHYAFNSVYLGNGVGIHEGRAIDSHADDAARHAARAKDRECRRWQDLSREQVFGSDLLPLVFMDGEGVRFVTPWLMTAKLKHRMVSIDIEPSANTDAWHDIDPTQFDGYLNRQVLSEHQQQSTASFMMLCLEDSYSHYRLTADQYQDDEGWAMQDAGSLLSCLHDTWADSLNGGSRVEWDTRWARVCKRLFDRGDGEVLFYFPEPTSPPT